MLDTTERAALPWQSMECPALPLRSSEYPPANGPNVPELTSLRPQYRRCASAILSPATRRVDRARIPAQQQHTIHSTDQWGREAREHQSC